MQGEFPLEACRCVRIHARTPAVQDTAQIVASAIARACGACPEIEVGGTTRRSEVSLELAELQSAEHYRLDVSLTRVRLVGGGEAGLFYAAQTFRQIVSQSRRATVPALKIADGPVYSVRGVYHDISRGKVPTRDTLFGLIERLAHYKVNQLQLYIEHTFAFANHPDIWAGSDPLTADDIREIDEHAARHHIELVPSLSTFGHFYTALVSPRKHYLNELLIDASQQPFSWWDRMGHYTLDCLNPESLDLVRELILELRPLFRSKLFNVCCDETFDLGRGRNAGAAESLTVGRLYVGFLLKIMAVVREAGATPMFWGDIIGRHPELVEELPTDAIALDWDYSAELHDSKATLFRKANRVFYVCPGVSGWDRWCADIDTASKNILGLAERGIRAGATGLLNTDWGDRGHINFLGTSWHGLVLGAAAAWQPGRTKPADFDTAFGAMELGDKTGRATALLREAGNLNVISWRLLTLWLDPTPHRPGDWWDGHTDLPKDLLAIEPVSAFAAAKRLERIHRTLGRLLDEKKMPDPGLRRELLLGCRGQALMNLLGGWIISIARHRQAARGAPPATEISNEVRRFETELSEVWHARNRPSEYWRLRTTLLELARRLDLAALRGTWVRLARVQPPPAAR